TLLLKGNRGSSYGKSKTCIIKNIASHSYICLLFYHSWARTFWMLGTECLMSCVSLKPSDAAKVLCKLHALSFYV
ncbi:hypothetical protein L9F63_013342, partial [Diploptera punctata]